MHIKNNITVIDNFLPVQYLEEIKRSVLSTEIIWTFVDDLSQPIQNRKLFNLQDALPGFCHNYYDTNRGVTSPGYGFVLPLLYFATDHIGITLNNLLMARSFLSMAIPNSEKIYDYPHIDIPGNYNYFNVIYYVDDSDGDTVFYNETQYDFELKNLSLEKLTERQRVTPKKGRAVVFDGNIYHTSTRPTSGVRAVINFAAD